MENRRAVIVAALIAVAVAGLIVGMVMFLSNLFRPQSGSGGVVNPSPAGSLLPVTSTQQSGGESPASATVATVKYVSVGEMSMAYPIKWGLLKCNNATNIEFDPDNSTDQSVECEYAVKPVTVLVEAGVNCQGESKSLGLSKVVYKKTVETNGVSYRWCVSGPAGSLDITHRMSSEAARATSKTDYSKEVEEMISSLKAGNAS